MNNLTYETFQTFDISAEYDAMKSKNIFCVTY